MILHFDHPALAFHCAAELPPQFRPVMIARPVRADRCYTAISTSTSSPQQITQTTSGATSPVFSASGSKSTLVETSGAPVITISGKGSSYNPTTTDEGAVAAGTSLASQALTTMASFFSTLTNQQTGVITGEQALTGQSLASNATLAAQTQSGGQTTTNSSITTWALIVGAVILGLALMTFYKKKT